MRSPSPFSFRENRSALKYIAHGIRDIALILGSTEPQHCRSVYISFRGSRDFILFLRSDGKGKRGEEGIAEEDPPCAWISCMLACRYAGISFESTLGSHGLKGRWRGGRGIGSGMARGRKLYSSRIKIFFFFFFFLDWGVPRLVGMYFLCELTFWSRGLKGRQERETISRLGWQEVTIRESLVGM